jgi:hypothetical protein
MDISSGVISVTLSDEDLLARLGNTEDNFVERKRFSDDRQWLRTAVAFANSCPIGYPGVLFIGAYDDGRPEQPKVSINLDSLQKTLAERLGGAWPPIFYLSKILRKDLHQFLAVLIPGSPFRPHFGGQSFVRIGSETRKASESQYEELIAQRQSKAHEILKWKDRVVTIERTYGGRSGKYSDPMKVSACNAFYVTLSREPGAASFSLATVNISYDHEQNRLKLQIHDQTA